MPTVPVLVQTRRRAPAATATVAITLLVVTVVVWTIIVVVDNGPTIGEIPDDGPWSIGISHPGGPQGDVTSCAHDRSVSSSLMTADLPSSSTSVQLEDTATRDDVQRVLDCLDDALAGGDITVATRP